MSGRYIAENVKKRLYAESMGRCMNPECQHNLFRACLKIKYCTKHIF